MNPEEMDYHDLKLHVQNLSKVLSVKAEEYWRNAGYETIYLNAHEENEMIIDLPSTNMTPEQALESAMRLNLTEVVVLGYDDEGKFKVRSSKMTRAEALFLIELGKKHALGE